MSLSIDEKTKVEKAKEYIQEKGYRYEFFDFDLLTDTHIRDMQR